MAYSEAQKKMHIKEIQGYLHGISYYNEKIPKIIPDGIYGKETQIAVKAFQQEYGLPVTGEVNKVTWDKIVEVYKKLVNTPPERINAFPSKSYIIKQGDKGYTVMLLQVMLNAISDNCNSCEKIGVTGFFDNSTVRAVKNFQSLTQRPQTGSVDLFTWNILVKAFNYIVS